MENKQLETSGSRKPRVSKGKLKKCAKKTKRQSQGFSSSFTQKTLHNNTLLAQSLAKEKSRNEKLSVLHRELMTSRNEALMRLNETEASFDRLGVLVQKGIRQMQEVASTMGEVYAEIRTSKNNPRDSASMRSSWDDTVTSAGRTIMKQPLPHMNGMQENVEVNDQSPQWPLLTPALPVSPIEEELDTTCSDDDTLREDSLVCRHAPTPRQPRNKCTLEFGDGVSALHGEGTSRPPRLIRKVERGMMKLPGHDFSSVSSWSEEYDVHNRTSLSLIDMDETVVHEEPTAQISEGDASHGTVLSFNTVTNETVDEESPEDLSYDEVFCILPKTDESQTVAKVNAPPDLTSSIGHAKFTDADCESLNRERPARTNSPDFLGLSNENINWPNHGTPYDGPSLSSKEEIWTVTGTPDSFVLPTVNSTSPKKDLRMKPYNGMSSTIQISKSPVPPRFLEISSGDNAVLEKKIHNKSPNVAQKQSKSSSAAHPKSKSLKVKAGSTSPSASGNVLKSDSSQKSVHNSKQYRPKLTKSPSLSKSTKIQQIIGLEQSNPSEHHIELPKVSEALLKHSTHSPTTTNNSDVFAKSDARDLLTITSLKMPLSATTSVEVSFGTTTRIPECAQSPTLLPSKATLNKSRKHQANKVIITSQLLTKPASVSEAKKSGQWDRAMFAAHGNLQLNTPELSIARETPSETKSANDCPRAEPERLPVTSRSADVPRATRPVGKPRRNTQDSDQSARHLRSWRRLKRDSPSAAGDANDTPSRGPKAKTPKVVALVNRLNNSPGSRGSLASEQDPNERRTRRRIVQANYKEPSLIKKIRRPVSKDHV